MPRLFGTAVCGALVTSDSHPGELASGRARIPVEDSLGIEKVKASGLVTRDFSVPCCSTMDSIAHVAPGAETTARMGRDGSMVSGMEVWGLSSCVRFRTAALSLIQRPAYKQRERPERYGMSTSLARSI